jgi:transposase-like protein
MAKPDKREEAERLYVRQAVTCADIAEQLEIDSGTVYRWKSEAAEKGEYADWDARRRAYNLSPKEIMSIYAESVKSWVLRLKENPQLMDDPKIADAISKHASVMKNLNAGGQYLGAVADLIKVTNDWLAKNQPELKEKMDPFWQQIFKALSDYASNKGIL